MTKQKQISDKFPMSEITVVEFESSTFGNQYVSELEDGPPFTVHGIALGADDVTVGASGIKKKWPSEELERAADTLKGTNLVVDHENAATGVVGRVTKSGYKEGTGVVYEAELYDEELAEKVKNGLLEVSIRGYHADVDSLEEDDETGAKVVEDIEFDNLSIVPSGAAPSNTLEMGEHAELSAAELTEFTDTLEAAELEEIEPGIWVQWGDKRGVTISQVEDGEVEVDIYEESDGKWRAIGQTEMVNVDTLSEWEVDEDEDIGSAKENESEEENEAVERGQFVKFKDVDNKWQHGQIISIDQDGAQMVATLRLFTENGDKLDDTTQKPVQGLDKWDDHPQPEDDVSDEQKVSDDPQSDASVKDVGLADILRVLSAFAEEAGVTTSDTPTQDQKPIHEPIGADTVESLLDQFVEEVGEDATIQEFREWLDVDILSDHDRGEGEEPQINSKKELKESRKKDPKWLDSEIEELALSDVDEEHRFNSREEAENFVDDSDIFEGVHKVGSVWVPGETHEEYMDNVSSNARHGGEEDEEEEEMASIDDYRHTVGVVEAFLEDSGSDESTVTDLLNWVDDDPVVERSVEEFKQESEEGSDEAPVKELQSWLNDQINTTDDEKKDEESEEASADEGRNMTDDEVSDVEELQEYEMHTPEWSGTTESDWSSPDMEDFDTDDLGEIADHFLISSSGFPPENFSDLKLPVVEPNGDLNLNALSAVKGGRGVSAVDGLSDSMEEDIINWVNNTANEEFDKDWGMDEEEAAKHHHEAAAEMIPEFLDVEGNSQDTSLSAFVEWADDENAQQAADEFVSKDGNSLDSPVSEFQSWLKTVLGEEEAEASEHSIDGTDGRPTPGENTVGGVRVLSGDDLQQGYKSEESEADSLTTYKVDIMTNDIEEKLAELEDPVAVEADEVEELRDKADRFEEMSENLEALRERTDILDDVDRSQVEELAESEDAVVVESSRYDELQDEAEQVASVYAAQLAEEYPAFTAEELTDKFSIEELREKFEEEVGEVEEELTGSEEAEPRSQDADEESLEEASEDDSDEAELSEEIAEKQDEIRDKILGGS